VPTERLARGIRRLEQGYKRFNAWSASRKWLKVFKTLVADTDMEWVFIDGSYAKAHQKSAGAAGSMDQAIGKKSSRQHPQDSFGCSCQWADRCAGVTGGPINDCTQAPVLIATVPAEQKIIAEKVYDSEAILEQIEQQDDKAVISRKRNADLDRGLYRNRHLVENAFARIKHYQAVASRFDKLKKN